MPPASGGSEVDRYILACPKGAQAKLRKVRATIRSAVPDATERISYRMPGYFYPGYRYKGMFVWFGLQSNHVGLYVRPPTIEDHREELADFTTTKSAVHLPLDRDVPVALVKTLVLASRQVMFDEKVGAART